MNTTIQLVERLGNWSNEGLAASFQAGCSNKDEAYKIQKEVSEYGFRGFVTHFGKEISVVFYLIDNKFKK